MDPSAPRICRWRGCYSFEVAAGSIYCSEHRALLHPGRRPQPDNQHALSTSSSNPALGPPNPLHAATSAKATSPKKQLSERYTARKGAKLSTSGPAHGPSATHTQRPSADVLSANPRPAKRQRGQDMPDVSGVPRSGSSSFSETGVPPLTNRGMFRQSEERSYKLSAVDDFALRPKKKETASERPRSFNDQRPLHRGGNHLGFTRRPASSSSRPLQSTSKKSPCPEPIVIDLTGDDDDEPPLIPPKTQSSIHNYVRYGISMGLQGPPKPHVSSNVAPGPSRQPKEVVTIGDKQRGESVQQSQPGPRSQVQHNKPVAENVVIPSSTAPLPSKSQNEHSFAVPTSKEKMDLSALSDRPVHAESSGTSTLKHHDSPDIQPRQPVKIDQPWLDGKKSPPVGSNPNASAPEQAMLGRIFQTTVRGKPPPVQEVKSKEAVKPREQSNPLSEQTKTKELVKATERDKTPKHSNAEEAAQATGQVKPVLEQPKVREASKTTELNGHVPTQTTAKEPSTNGGQRTYYEWGARQAYPRCTTKNPATAATTCGSQWLFFGSIRGPTVEDHVA
ncbi:hypothetical protein F4808DRAFT_296034 [Astrocystis sublimbata]|nr:hypothetical protein F4808DRAFT_296034 [Astrocystis sublimbata]